MAPKSFRFPQIFSWVDFQQSMPPRIQSILPTFKERRLFGLLGFKPAGALETDSSILVRCFFNTGYMNLLLLEKNLSRNNMETPNKKIREKRRKNTGNFPRWFFPPVLLSPPDQRPVGRTCCSVQVYSIDLASSQRSYLEKLAKETSLLSYGYDPTSLGKHWK